MNIIFVVAILLVIVSVAAVLAAFFALGCIFVGLGRLLG